MTTPTTPTTPQGKLNKLHIPPHKTIGAVVLVIFSLIAGMVYLQYRGTFISTVQVTMLAPRAGLVMDPTSKVSFHGVQVGRVAEIREVRHGDDISAEFTLDIYPRYLKLIPADIEAKIAATTLFGGKYVSLNPPEDAGSKRLAPGAVIDAREVTTEINTLLLTISSLSEKVDPIKLNLTLGAAAEALNGLGDEFGESIVNTNAILDQLNPMQPQLRHDIRQLAELGDIYADAAPDLLASLDHVVTTARTLNAQQKDLDTALLAAIGLGNSGADVLGRGGPYLERAIDDLLPTTKLLDDYSPELFCAVRKAGEIQPKLSHVLGGKDGYALDTNTVLLGGLGQIANPAGLLGAAIPTMGLGGLFSLVGGTQNPYVYPENLPRHNARGGPAGAPGCWQEITRDLWPGPYLIMDTGASIAPYNHLDTGSPLGVEHVWGRMWGEHTINP